ncbi:MAG: serine/threonine protein kinase [Deltaproteobacteria bacterium]|nr:serine/threonine protein kinase [Deltaproteobacteria bacterium]
MDCLDTERATEFLRGRIAREQLPEMGDHISSCPKCKELLRKVAGRTFSSLSELFDDQDDTQPRNAAPKVGQVLGERFRIVRLLGEGAMGLVFEAEDELLDVRVALKVLKPACTAHSTFLKRVKREILVGRRITHPHVARVYDLWTTDGLHYIQMELLSGATLDARMEQGPIAPEAARDLLVQIAGALEAAHREGVVHRDLKPSNMMVDPSGKLTVADFGLAMDLRSSGSLSAGLGPIGTPAYWAPEQARCEPATPASDVFSYGVLAHQLLLGEFPALGVPLSSKLPSWFRPIIERCIQSRPERRFASGVELMDALCKAGLVPGRRAGPVPGPRTSHLGRWLWGVGVVFAAAALLVVLGSRSLTPRSVEPVQIAAPGAAPDAAAWTVVTAAGSEKKAPDASEPLHPKFVVVKRSALPRFTSSRRPVDLGGSDASVTLVPNAGGAHLGQEPALEPQAQGIAPGLLAGLRERLGHLDGSLAARHINPEDITGFPEAVATARRSLAEGKGDDALEALSRAEALVLETRVDRAFVDRRLKRLTGMAKSQKLAPEAVRMIDEIFPEVHRAFFKGDFELANAHLARIQEILAGRGR